MLKYLSEVDDGTTDLHPKIQTGARWDQFFSYPRHVFGDYTDRWPSQEPKLEVPTIYKAYF